VTRAFVLLTALPPTIGHLQVIRFASELEDEVHVLVCTQPGEPYAVERVDAVARAAQDCPRVRVHGFHRTVPQEPGDAPDFWPMWRTILREHGFRDGDTIVASEPYGARLAEAAGGCFVPYDIERAITPVRAVDIRRDPIGRFGDVLPEFQPAMMRRIAVIGAESTGKTTLSRQLAEALPGHWLPEWARPYLEGLPTPDVDDDRMRVIWRAQLALQRSARKLRGRPFIVGDTDLYATIGYWEAWDPGTVPDGLRADAAAERSDLYLVTRSDIPFEPDPLRYGGDVRETTDEFWIELAERNGLPYRVVGSVSAEDRLAEARELVIEDFHRSVPIGFMRQGLH
jgi:HTH-type transcriptional regulator, transcriptional repressor of NAD biosynthesis genes